VLENRAFVERLAGRDLLSLSGYYFQGLREEDDQDQIPVVLPLAESRLVTEPRRWGSRWSLDTSLLGLTRTGGLDTRRFSTRGAWRLPLTGAIGDLYQVEASLRGDAYYTAGDTEDLSEEGGESTKARLLPQLTTDWAWPLVGDGLGWTYQVEPLASLTLATPDANDDAIPNEDSRDFELDETNLFEPARFPGLDRVEGGGRVAYGLRFSGFGPGAMLVSGALGQSWRAYGSSPFPEGTGLDDRLSDYVGRIDVRPSALLDLGFRFRVAKDDLELRRSDIGLAAGPSWLRVNLDYINLSREPDSLDEQGFDSREELRLGARAQVTSTLALAAQTRQDLTRDATVANQLGLLYTHPCLTLLAGFERSFTTTGELDDETTVLVRLAFRNLGELQTGSFLGLD
jgi:LPS-assembly protein